MKILLAALTFTTAAIIAAPPTDAVPLDAPELQANYRLHIEFPAPAEGAVRLGKNLAVRGGVARLWLDGEVVNEGAEICKMLCVVCHWTLRRLSER